LNSCEPPKPANHKLAKQNNQINHLEDAEVTQISFDWLRAKAIVAATSPSDGTTKVKFVDFLTPTTKACFLVAIAYWLSSDISTGQSIPESEQVEGVHGIPQAHRATRHRASG